MRPALRHVLGHPLAQNTLAIYAVHVANLGLPLLSIPYLARVLSPHSWGLFVMAQSLGLWLGILIEYGFNLSGTREVARDRHDLDAVSRVVGGVFSARLGLALAAVVLAALLSLVVESLREQPSYLLAALMLAVGQGFSALWYFQGIERVRLAAALEVGSRAVGVLLIFVVVDRPGQGAVALLLTGFGAVLGSLLTTALVYRSVAFVAPRIGLALDTLRMGWTIFLSRAGLSLYTTVNPLLLGLFASPAEVGYFGGADKITKAAVFMLAPITITLFPRVSYLESRDPRRAHRLVVMALAVCGSLGVLSGIGLAIFAPAITHLVLGPDLRPAADFLPILAIILPMVGVNSVFAMLWMLPHGLERSLTRVILAGGITNVLLALVLAPRFAGVGMSWAIVGAEVTITILIFLVVRRRGFFSPVDPTPGRGSLAHPDEGE